MLRFLAIVRMGYSRSFFLPWLHLVKKLMKPLILMGSCHRITGMLFSSRIHSLEALRPLEELELNGLM